MNLTVAICTWNRAPLLRRALESLAVQRGLRGTTWELLVINNNCTDETDAVIAAFQSRLPIRGLHEPNPGLSNARNRAIAAASGDYIVWTDDDVVVCPEWLSAYARAFQAWPDHAVFGGPIRPDFEGNPPDWLLSIWPQVEGAYAIRDIDPAAEDLAIAAGREPFGANFAVRSDLQRSHPFDSQLGKSPDHPFLGGEECMVIRAILGNGHRGRWVPDAVVHHWVPRTRQSTRHIRNYWKGYGTYKAMAKDFAGQPRILGVPRWLIRARVEYGIRYRAGRLLRKPDKWIHDLTRLGFAEGQLTYVRAHRRREHGTVRHRRIASGISDSVHMLKMCDRALRDTVRALLGPRDAWKLSSRATRLAADLPSRLGDALARTRPDTAPTGEQPVFLLSAGWRSGSTLLQRMIMEHNHDILIWGEPFAHCNIHDNLLNQFRAFTRQWPHDAFFLSKMAIERLSDSWTANLYPDIDYLFDAHRSFYHRLFADPAAQAGRESWGFKEVRLTIEHAMYFRTLYPNCKIVLLYRHPFDAYLSYRGWHTAWARTWPRYIATPYAFGLSWAEIVRGYLEGHARVNALLIRYEDLDNPADVARLESYLGWPVPTSSQMRRISRTKDPSPAHRNFRKRTLPVADRVLLKLATRNVLRDAGYASR